MFNIFKIRTELIKAQRAEILALKNLIRVLKNQVNILEKIRKMDEMKILRLEDEADVRLHS